MCIRDRCFEDIASTSALVRKVTALKNDGTHYDGRRIIALSQQNDIICQQAIDEMCLALAKGIANICYITNPDTIVLGGGLKMCIRDSSTTPAITKMNTWFVSVLNWFFKHQIFKFTIRF